MRKRIITVSVLAMVAAVAGPAFAGTTEGAGSGVIGAARSQMWDGNFNENTPAYGTSVTKTNYVSQLGQSGYGLCGKKVRLADGLYESDVTVVQDCSPPRAPLVITAVNAYGVEFRGKLTIGTGARYVVVTKLEFNSNGNVASSGGLIIKGKYVRASRNKFLNIWDRRPIEIHYDAEKVVVDRNTIQNYHQQGISFTTDAGLSANYVHILRNYIVDKLPPPSGVNGNLEEAIQVGEDAPGSLNDIYAFVELNVVKNNQESDDPVSIKSSYNTVLNNYIVNTSNGINIRNGERNLLQGNYVADAVIGVMGRYHRLVANEATAIRMVKGTVADDDLTAEKTGTCAAKNAAHKITMTHNKGKYELGTVNVSGCAGSVYRPVHDIRVENHTGSRVNGLWSEPVWVGATTESNPGVDGRDLVSNTLTKVGADASQ